MLTRSGLLTSLLLAAAVMASLTLAIMAILGWAAIMDSADQRWAPPMWCLDVCADTAGPELHVGILLGTG